MEHEHIKNYIDFAAIGTAIATFAGWLPSIAAFLSVVWTAGRLIEMWTGKPFSLWRKGQ